MKASVIIISGRMGSGKTTTQTALRAALYKTPNTYCYPMNFADKIYEIHDFARNTILKTFPNHPKKDGRLLQLLGTEWGRHIHPDIWVNVVKSRIDEICNKSLKWKDEDHLVFLIGDCRFRNEFDAFPDGLRIRLEAPREVRKARCDSWRDNETHPSEIDLDSYEDKFEMKFDTSLLSTEQIVEEIVQALKAN